ncbi:MAG: ThiF family adenylyltransferase [Planctomycetia bacterium]|nr:ThiF family adenylyltransferase [Planctomycetia bacterium]
MNTSFPDRDIRQRGLVPADKLSRLHLLVIGVGAIGRQVALQLATLGVQRMTLVDHDHVAEENLAVQGYRPDDLGHTKVQATSTLCLQILPSLQMTMLTERFRRQPGWSADSDRIPVIMVCVDSITTRRIIWETLKGRFALLVDGRMQAEVMRVLAQDERTNPQHYQNSLFSESEAQSGPCTARSTIYTASIAAGLMIAQLVRWLRQVPLIPDQTLNLLSGELIINE